jgi:NTE family protein
LSQKRIGLALGSGAARGLAHIGVLEVFERERISIDNIAGTSAGAVIGALYAQGKDAAHIAGLVKDLNWKKIASLIDLTLPKDGFIVGRKIKNLLASAIGDIEFSDLKIPLSCIATDFETGEEIVINHGSVLEAIRASISLPVVFTLTKWHGRYLIDVGLVNPVPISIAKGMGSNYTIAVNVMPEIGKGEQQRYNEQISDIKKPNIIHVIMQSLHIATHTLVRASLEKADIVIEPHVAHIPVGDFHQAEECIAQGRIAAKGAINEIKRQLGENKYDKFTSSPRPDYGRDSSSYC